MRQKSPAKNNCIMISGQISISWRIPIELFFALNFQWCIEKYSKILTEMKNARRRIKMGFFFLENMKFSNKIPYPKVNRILIVYTWNVLFDCWNIDWILYIAANFLMTKNTLLSTLCLVIEKITFNITAYYISPYQRFFIHFI